MNKKILEHFKKQDALLYSAAVRAGALRVLEKEVPENYFLELCSAIVGQQLSGKAADSIFARFKKSFPRGVTPGAILSMPHEKLRAVGLSNAKVKYLKHLSEAVVDKTLDIDNLDKLPDGEIIRQLTQIKGIGPWTAEMFLMFTLAREDVYSHGDLGLKKGMQKVYGFKKHPSVRTAERIIKKWSPFKTYGALILWRSLEI